MLSVLFFRLVPWLGRLVAGIVLRVPRFVVGLVRMVFVVDTVAQECVRVLQISSVNVISAILRIYLNFYGALTRASGPNLGAFLQSNVSVSQEWVDCTVRVSGVAIHASVTV